CMTRLPPCPPLFPYTTLFRSRLSTPAPAWVIVSSVLSGRISLTARTRVVLPTPNPPTTTIFNPCAAVAGSTVDSEVVECNENLLQHGRGNGDCRGTRSNGVAGCDVPCVEQVGQQDAHHGDRQFEPGGDLHNRHRTSAHLQDASVFRLHSGRRVGLGDDERHRVECLVPTAAASGGDD